MGNRAIRYDARRRATWDGGSAGVVLHDELLLADDRHLAAARRPVVAGDQIGEPHLKVGGGVHCPALARLASRLQRRVGRLDSVRLLALDRFGVRFRVQSRGGCYDLRVPFPAPLDGPVGFGDAVEHLLTCGRD